jgi:hypothetical protein
VTFFFGTVPCKKITKHGSAGASDYNATEKCPITFVRLSHDLLTFQNFFLGGMAGLVPQTMTVGGMGTRRQVGGGGGDKDGPRAPGFKEQDEW